MGVGRNLSRTSFFGESDAGSVVATGDGLPGSDQAHPLTSLALVLVLGVGAHASKQALGPLEPSLSAMGVGPIGFAILTITPGLAAMVMPLAWGAAWTMHARLVLRASPLLQLMAQVLLAGGVALRTWNVAAPLLTGAVLVSGLVLFSIGRAGLAVAQHATLARLYRSHLVLAFAAMTGWTQLITSAMNLIVPRILEEAAARGAPVATEPSQLVGGRSEAQASAGLLAVQLALLIPHTLSAVAGALLASSRPRVAASSYGGSVDSSAWFRESSLCSDAAIFRSDSFSQHGSRLNSPMGTPHRTPSDATVTLAPPPLRLDCPLLGTPAELPTLPVWRSAAVGLALWRALAIGSLHALKPVIGPRSYGG